MTAAEYDEAMQIRENLLEPSVVGIPDQVEDQKRKAYWVKNIEWNPMYLTAREAEMFVELAHAMFGFQIKLHLDHTNQKEVLIRKQLKIEAPRFDTENFQG